MPYTMTTQEAADLLGVSARRVQVLARAGRLRAKKWGRDYRLDPESVAAFVPMPQGRPKKKTENS